MQIEKMSQALGINLPETLLTKLAEKEMWLQLADAPFPYSRYKATYDGSVYVSQQDFADRNALLFDRYRYVAEKEQVDTNTWSVGVWVNLECTINGQEYFVRQYGVNTVNRSRNEKDPTGDSIQQAIKSAVSDGMKKCSSWLGIAAHVFRGDITSIKPKRNKDGKAEGKLYLETLDNFGLNEYNFRYGIPVLPDHFRSYYEIMGWTDGIFHSDVFGGKKSRSQQPNESSRGYNGTEEKNKDLFITEEQADSLRLIIHSFNPDVTEQEMIESIVAHFKKREVDIHQEIEVLGKRFNTLNHLPAASFSIVRQLFNAIKQKRVEEAKSA